MSVPPSSDDPQKEALVSALEFTKFVITVDAALIAFVTGATFLETIASRIEAVVVIVVLILLAVSIVAGLFVYMRVPPMLKEKNYDLKDRWLEPPGIVNVVCFGVGAAGVGALAVLELLVAPAPSKATVQQFEIRCAQVSQAPSVAHCRGRATSFAK